MVEKRLYLRTENSKSVSVGPSVRYSRGRRGRSPEEGGDPDETKRVSGERRSSVNMNNNND